MKKNKFKFKMEERVFIAGNDGFCVVTGRGVMDFISGGSLNMYQVAGGHSTVIPEHLLIPYEEARSGKPAKATA